MVSGDTMHLLFCVLSIEIGWHIDYRVTFANKYSELARRQPDVREFFFKYYVCQCKPEKNSSRLSNMQYKVLTYIWKT